MLPNFQYGYRKKHSTSQAILDFANTIEDNRRKNLTSIAVFMDLSKAFDTVDKSILINKMKRLGFDEKSTKFIYDYLSDRKFCFSDQTGIVYNLDYGVPQGSILGPLLFIMYIYDIKYLCPYDKSIVYADDTTVIVAGRNLNEASQKCNSILERFAQYFQINRLSINSDKTKYIVYLPRIKKRGSSTSKVRISMKNVTIEQVNSIKFLGIIINKALNWEEHKQYVRRKIARTVGILYNCRGIMSEIELINLYKTFIQSNLLYAIEVWGHTVTSESDILNKIHNRVLRIIFNCRRTEDAWYHNNNRIQNIQELYTQKIIRICLKHHYKQLPDYFSSQILPEKYCDNNVNFGYNLRSNEHKPYNYKRCKESNLKFTESCFKIWNSMSLKTKQKPYLF